MPKLRNQLGERGWIFTLRRLSGAPLKNKYQLLINALARYRRNKWTIYWTTTGLISCKRITSSGSGTGRSSADRSTFRPERRQCGGEQTLRRGEAKVGFVPEGDIQALRLEPSLYWVLLGVLRPDRVGAGLHLGPGQTWAHTFIWRRTQWACEAVHPKAGEESSDE